MSFTSKEEFFAVRPRLLEVSLPEMGNSFFIRPITTKEQSQLADLGVKFENAAPSLRVKHITIQMIIWAVCNKDGEAMFDEHDVDNLFQIEASVLLRLQDKIVKFSGLTEESRKEIEKNSLTAPVV